MTKQLTKKQQELEVMNAMDEVGGAGFEDADVDAFAVPFLRVLQTNSPQVNEDEESHIKGAKAGMFFNTVTSQLYGKKVKIIPVFYQRDFVEWQPDRGGFVMSHGSDPVIMTKTVRDDGDSVLPNGNLLSDMRNHFVLLADHLEDGPIILSLTSTGLRHSKRWMTAMKMLKTPNDKPAPMFSSIYEITTILNENDQGKWYQLGDQHTTAIVREKWVSKTEWDAALAAKDLIGSGKAKADYESTIDQTADDEEVPF